MHPMNFWLTMAISAIVPSVVGMIWYNPKVFGTAWLSAGKLDPVKLKEGFNLPLTLGICYVLSFMVSMLLAGIVIHQMGFWSMLQMHWKDDPKVAAFFMETMKTYGNDFRTFKHGALHGFLTGLFIATPVISFGALWERRGFKYVAINAGFWILTLMIMGGIICMCADPSTMM